MKKAQRGFTLVELLVALLCSMLVLGMLAGAAVFITRTSRELMNKGSSLFRTKAVYEYVCLLHLSDSDIANGDLSIENGALIHNGAVILQTEDIEEITFSSKDGFIYCELTYTDRTTISFVAGKESRS